MAGGRGCDQSVNQVMATAAALIAAKKAKDKEAALAREKQEKEVGDMVKAEAEAMQQSRQLQQREMTPDNLKIVEQKLLEFQKQQQEVRLYQSFIVHMFCYLSHLKIACNDLKLLLVRMSV